IADALVASHGPPPLASAPHLLTGHGLHDDAEKVFRQPMRHRLPGLLDVAQCFPQSERVAGLAVDGLIRGQLLKEGSFLVGRKHDVAVAVGDLVWDAFGHGVSMLRLRCVQLSHPRDCARVSAIVPLWSVRQGFYGSLSCFVARSAATAARSEGTSMTLATEPA